MYVLLCSLHSIYRFLFNYSIKVIVVLTTFSIISIPYLLNSVLQPYIMPIYSIILLYLSICNMSHVLEINYLILSYLLSYNHPAILTLSTFSVVCFARISHTDTHLGYKSTEKGATHLVVLLPPSPPSPPLPPSPSPPSPPSLPLPQHKNKQTNLMCTRRINIHVT